MNVELSRRVGRINSEPAIRNMSIETRGAFREAVHTARSFAALEKKWRDVIEEAERTLAEGGDRWDL